MGQLNCICPSPLLEGFPSSNVSSFKLTCLPRRLGLVGGYDIYGNVYVYNTHDYIRTHCPSAAVSSSWDSSRSLHSRTFLSSPHSPSLWTSPHTSIASLPYLINSHTALPLPHIPHRTACYSHFIRAQALVFDWFAHSRELKFVGTVLDHDRRKPGFYRKLIWFGAFFPSELNSEEVFPWRSCAQVLVR